MTRKHSAHRPWVRGRRQLDREHRRLRHADLAEPYAEVLRRSEVVGLADLPLA
ncbi:MAG: hypothetical protein M3O65_05260 [Actinomycetota bacterium]|nr:hypothetical protein [Actinomycetota bacterium]